MSIELLFLLVIIIDLLILLIAFRMGENYLKAAIMGSVILANITVGKFVTLFGYDVSIGVIPFAGIFLATDIFGEYFGIKKAHQTIRMSLLILLMFAGFGQIVSFFEPTSFSIDASNAINMVMQSSLRVTLASVSVYYISGSFDIWWYEKLRQWFPTRKFLRVRNIFSTTVSQFIDSFLFLGLAFVGTMPNMLLFELILTLYAVKVVVALIDTPFMYMAHYFAPPELRTKKVNEENMPQAHII